MKNARQTIASARLLSTYVEWRRRPERSDHFALVGAGRWRHFKLGVVFILSGLPSQPLHCGSSTKASSLDRLIISESGCAPRT
jgi:hypothetical protein